MISYAYSFKKKLCCDFFTKKKKFDIAHNPKICGFSKFGKKILPTKYILIRMYLTLTKLKKKNQFGFIVLFYINKFINFLTNHDY